VQRFQAPANEEEAEKAHNEALAENREQRRQLDLWLWDALVSADFRLANSAEWIILGRSYLYAVTPTGDSADRVAQRERKYNIALPKGTQAWFPCPSDTDDNSRHFYDDTEPSYAFRDLDNNGWVRFERQQRGWADVSRTPSAISITPAAMDCKQSFFATLKHEVQHAADRSADVTQKLSRTTRPDLYRAAMKYRPDPPLESVSSQDATVGDPIAQLDPGLAREILNYRTAKRWFEYSGDFGPNTEEALRSAYLKAALRCQYTLLGLPYWVSARMRFEDYMTEYRAYSYQGTYGDLDNGRHYYAQDGTAYEGTLWTSRQWAIFHQIRQSYDHTSAGWSDNHQLYGLEEAFQEAVQARYKPGRTGKNKWNSIRIAEVYDQLLTVAPGTDTVTPAVRAVMDAARRLKQAEAKWLAKLTEIDTKGSLMWPSEFGELFSSILTGEARSSVHDVLAQIGRWPPDEHFA
jgi:hypothetical protein